MKAAILLQRGPNEDKQIQACLDYLDEQHWDLGPIIPYWSPETATTLVLAGAIGIVLVACFQKSLTAIAADIGDRGKVIYVHPAPTVVTPPRHAPSLGDLIRRLRGRGDTTADIAALFEIDSGEVRRIIRDDDGRSGRNE